ncbi:hypothetical protein HPP92_025670 [Vanilla planifolia]|uniref:Alpha/beta hydrolase fold-3 domain-containing protein n=1 Tax=Vanilla planifolia TaxID=51239 RepID=A0A835U9E0_VANPL|nr:hypothetical protein HPP92_025941 [Vanilla planifolia]KAG0454366.1 hypothetical protein HPP92_025670 [Vanilla planifolia]
MGVRLGREGREVEGMALVHPFFWGRERIGRESEERKGVLFQARDACELWRLACPKAVDGLDSPWLNPFVEGGSGLAGLGCRRLIVCVAGMDILWDRGRAYYEKLVFSGWPGEAELFESDGVDHGFHLFQRRSVQAANLMQRLVNFFNKGRKNCALGVLSVNGIGHEANPTASMLAKL